MMTGKSDTEPFVAKNKKAEKTEMPCLPQRHDAAAPGMVVSVQRLRHADLNS